MKVCIDCFQVCFSIRAPHNGGKARINLDCLVDGRSVRKLMVFHCEKVWVHLRIALMWKSQGR